VCTRANIAEAMPCQRPALLAIVDGVHTCTYRIHTETSMFLQDRTAAWCSYELESSGILCWSRCCSVRPSIFVGELFCFTGKTAAARSCLYVNALFCTVIPLQPPPYHEYKQNCSKTRHREILTDLLQPLDARVD
jgi:hypothetical protein